MVHGEALLFERRQILLLEELESEIPAAGVSGGLAKVPVAGRTTPGELKTEVKRSPFWWHDPQFGSSSQPVRAGAPTSLMVPWHDWHCIDALPSAATAAPIAPRRQRVSEPGWHW